MDLLDRVKRLMDTRGENNSTLAKNSGIPYTTIDGLFKRGWEKAQLSTIQKIADYYKVSLDYLVYGAQGLSEETLFLASKIDAIKDPISLELIKSVVEIETRRITPSLRMKVVPTVEELFGVKTAHDSDLQARYNARQEVQELINEQSSTNPEKI